MRPRSMPKLSLSTLASGASQLVVQDALLMIVFEPSYFSWLTPMTMVRSSPVAGAEITDFLAPPASTCLRASSALVKKPVDSTTTSTPRSPQGRLAGSRSERTFMVFPAILMPSPSAARSEEHTSELQSRQYLVCRLLLEKNIPLIAVAGTPADRVGIDVIIDPKRTEGWISEDPTSAIQSLQQLVCRLLL